MERETQSIVFNTTDKTVKFYSGVPERSSLIKVYENIPTVRTEDRFYEVIQNTHSGTRKPVLRLPISNTNMFIED